MQTEELKKQLKSIPMSVGGCSIFYDKDRKRYYFVEHPTEGMWVISNELWYTWAPFIDLNKLELIYYR